ncbi:MAG: cysteine desulfurase [Nitrospinae bacterium]|nr:cysteine desulfurase [Nitrospinota bacterium]
MIDTEKYKSRFQEVIHPETNEPVIYLDNATTTLKPTAIINEIGELYKEVNSQRHRNFYPFGKTLVEKYEEARQKVADFIGAESANEIIFTKNATEAINLLAYSWARKYLRKGDNILLSVMEHHSNLVPWQILSEEIGINIRYISVRENGNLLETDFNRKIDDRTKLVAITHASNVLGTINNVEEFVGTIREKGIKLLIDGSQSIPHIPINVQELGCDFFVFSGHKMMAPHGVGVLYGKEQTLAKMKPFLSGSNMVSEVTFKFAKPHLPPWKFEAGSINYIEAIGLGMAIDFLNEVGMENIMEYEKQLMKYTINNMLKNEAVILYGRAKDRVPNIAFNIRGAHPDELAKFLEKAGIIVSSGSHNAQPLINFLNLKYCVRISLYFYNSIDEVDKLLELLFEAKKLFSNVEPVK